MRVVEVGHYLMTKDVGVFRQIRSVACREYTLHRGRSSFTTKRIDSRKHENWACIRSHNQFFKTANMELKFESGLWVKIILSPGSEYFLERTNT